MRSHRGRKSQAEIAAKPVVVQGPFKQRLDPPEDLTEEQGAVWRETVASEASDVFSTAATRALLKDYCRHRAEADRISETINQFKTEWLKSGKGLDIYRALARQRGEEAYNAMRLARSLRLTNQSRYTPQYASAAASRALKGKLPWDDDAEDFEA